MVSLQTQKNFRAVQQLPFCYLCGETFVAGDDKNRDYAPPNCMFAETDREPLILLTHVTCNSSHELTDEKSGQLIALKRHEVASPDSDRLKFALSSDMKDGVLINVDVDGAVWRWIKGFHAALYCEPLIHPEAPPATGRPYVRALVTPFPRARQRDGNLIVEQLLPQHLNFVQTIKTNRAKNNLDRICCNKGKLTYECVWAQADNDGPWLCIFALDIYDWKDLGRTRVQPARGCAGCYVLACGDAPAAATRAVTSSIIIPNFDPVDPFCWWSQGESNLAENI